MSCERVIFPQEPARFSRTKWWPKLKIVSFDRFGLSNGVDNTPIYFSKSEISQHSNHPHFLSCSIWKRGQKYPVCGPIFRAGYFQLSGKSGIWPDSKNTIRCTPNRHIKTRWLSIMYSMLHIRTSTYNSLRSATWVMVAQWFPKTLSVSSSRLHGREEVYMGVRGLGFTSRLHGKSLPSYPGSLA